MCFLTECREDFLEFVISVVLTKVFDVDISELHSFGAKLHLSFLAGLKVANKTAANPSIMEIQESKLVKSDCPQCGDLSFLASARNAKTDKTTDEH